MFEERDYERIYYVWRGGFSDSVNCVFVLSGIVKKNRQIELRILLCEIICKYEIDSLFLYSAYP